MFRLFVSCLFACYIFLSFCELSKCEFELNVESQNFKDHESNVYRMQEIVQNLNYDIAELKRSSTTQHNALKELQEDNGLSPENSEDTCERITLSFNSTQRKYSVVEERILLKLQEINDEQMDNLRTIMNRKNCNVAAAAALLSAPVVESITPETLKEFEEKFTNLETELHRYEEQQKLLQQKNEEQLKILRNINAELNGHHVELENFEKQLSPMIQNAIEAVVTSQGKDNGKFGTIPMGMVMALSQNKKKV
ncbi:uncharacterized protein [Musca autumnalis]|uniref:uncharacterized protein n=1 Tax=Musca autumnalis TaxID=221902 RepID=UPI003CF2F3CC